MVAQIANNGPRVFGIEIEMVQANHSTHRHLPAFGRLSLERDSLHGACAVLLMTANAVANDGALGDRESARCIRGRPACATARSTASAPLRVSGRNWKDQRREKRKSEPSTTPRRNHTGHQSFAPVRVGDE